MNFDSGQQHGKITLISPERTSYGKRGWRVKCGCGNVCVIDERSLLTNKRGCLSCSRKIGGRPNLIDVTGQRFGNLLVKEPTTSKHNTTVWRCLCDCGNERVVTGIDLRKGIVTACKTCVRPGRERKYASGEISVGVWNGIARRAADRNIDFEITEGDAYDLYVIQKGKCALTGVSISFNIGGRSRNNTASLDRIDSNIGYISGNVQWVHKEINMIKREFSQDRFIELCEMVHHHQCKKAP